MGATSFFSELSRHVKSKSRDDGVHAGKSSPHGNPDDSVDEPQDMSSSIPAWHVHGSRPSSAGQTENNSMAYVIHGSDVQAPMLSSITSNIPSRSSSLRSGASDHARHRRKSLPRPDLDRIDSETIPGLKPEDMTMPARSTTHYHLRDIKPHLGGEREQIKGRLEQLSLQDDAAGTQDHSHHNNQNRAQHEISRTNNDLRLPKRPSSSHDKSAISAAPDPNLTHLRLPPGFQLRDSSHTVVDTMTRPAVTHETIHRNVTEIQQEVVTRDIHFHHYYNYIQPVKVVEILPAKHYILNAKGEKVEIPAPPGWQMPSSLTPHSPDLSGIRGSVRHYLVNEQYPGGIDEPAPSNYSYDITPKILPNNSL